MGILPRFNVSVIMNTLIFSFDVVVVVFDVGIVKLIIGVEGVGTRVLKRIVECFDVTIIVGAGNNSFKVVTFDVSKGKSWVNRKLALGA